MKKIILTLCLSIMSLSCFAGGGYFELGAGMTRPGALLRSEPIDWRQSALAFAAIKLPVVAGFSIGTQYTCLPATGTWEDLTIPGLYRSFTSISHSLNLIAEYEFLRKRDVSPFVSIGCGPRLSVIKRFISDVASGPRDLSWMTNYQVQFGVEFYSRVRVTVGHVEQTSPVNATSGTGLPAWYVALSVVL